MNTKSFALKSIIIVLILLSSIFLLAASIALIGIVFNPGSKDKLYSFLGSLIICAIFLGITFYLAKSDKKKNKAEKLIEAKEIFLKMPLILASCFITSIYVLLYFFLFAFITTSEYGKGGAGGDASSPLLLIVFITCGIFIFALVMYKVFKTEKQDITLTLFNQFSILKWTSLIILPFGLWASYFYYHNEGSGAWIAMIAWGIVFYLIYKLLSRLSEKVQNQIIDSNINRILHEKKKGLINNKPSGDSVATELMRFKNLYDQGVLTQKEFEKQKMRLLS
jgi:hypothetical protein